MKQLVIFDLDGTLLNTIEDLGNACNAALQSIGLGTHPIDEYPMLVGNGIYNLMRKAIRTLPTNDTTRQAHQTENDATRQAHQTGATYSDEEVERLMERMTPAFKDYYGAHKTDCTRPYDGIPELLASLQKQGVLLAVASNKYQEATEEIVAHYFGDIRWTAVLGQREGIAKKPDPGIVEEIIAAAGGRDGLSVLYVGDSDVDMQTAGNAGVESIGVTWGFRTEAELMANGASHIVHTPTEIETEVRVQRAIDYFMQGYNCCQAVVCALADRYGIAEETALKMSAAFGGGTGRMRLTCGAANGMFMLAGFEKGQTRPHDNAQKMACYAMVQELAEAFKQEHGSMVCAELLQMRAGGSLPPDKYAPKPDDRTAEYYKQRPCLRMIAGAVRIWEQGTRNKEQR